MKREPKDKLNMNMDEYIQSKIEKRKEENEALKKLLTGLKVNKKSDSTQSKKK